MSQRHSEYERIPGDLYVTPAWVYTALFDIESFTMPWDCAPVCAEFDFLNTPSMPFLKSDIVTNPPFSLAEKFARHAIKLTEGEGGKVAMLLPHAWDTAKSRRDLFEVAPFKAKYAITERIRWENLEQKKNGPSSNHAWYIWDWSYTGKPFMDWLPKRQAA